MFAIFASRWPSPSCDVCEDKPITEQQSMSQLVLVFLTDVLKCLYKLSTSKIFEKNTSTTENSETNGKDPPSEGSSGNNNSESCPSSMVDIDCFAVNMVELCVRSRTLLVAGSSHVIVYQFSMTEETLELVVSGIVVSDLMQ